MNHSRIYPAALFAGAIGTVMTMIFHPTGADLLNHNPELAQRGEMMAVATHSLALISIPILFFGFVGVYYRFGRNSPLASAALVAYLFAAFSVICAAIFSGLVAPGLTSQMLAADESSRLLLGEIFHYNFALNQAFTKVFVVASSISVVLWSILILKSGRFAQITGVIGIVIAVVSLAAFFAGHLRLDVHGFGLFILSQTVWIILLGIFLWREESAD